MVRSIFFSRTDAVRWGGGGSGRGDGVGGGGGVGGLGQINGWAREERCDARVFDRFGVLSQGYPGCISR